MTQTQWVMQQLHRFWPNLEITIEQIRTTGDRITNKQPSQIGGDGIFVAEIERALTEGRIDLAVHSLKDLPTAQPEGLRLFVAGPREDVRDVFVSNREFHIVDGHLQATHAENTGAPLRIATGSLRRTAQLRSMHPDVQISPLRGNVDTRLRKLETGDYDGIVLASAGLHRLGMREQLAHRLTYFPVELIMPAPGQGALGLEVRDEPQLCELLAPLNDPAVQAATSAERLFMRRLGAGCYLPIAADGKIVGPTLSLSGLVISLDGQRRIDVRQSIPWTPATSIEQAEQLGVCLAEQALERGAAELIQQLDRTLEQEHQHA